MILTGFGLQLPTTIHVNTLTPGSVSINAGSQAVNFNQNLNLSTEWNYANKSTNGFLSLLGAGFVNTTFSSVENGQATPFAGSGSINGPDFGAISALETQFGNSQEAVADTIKFVINFTGPVSIADIDAGNVAWLSVPLIEFRMAVPRLPCCGGCPDWR